MSGGLPATALRSADSASMLKRVTIVASQPDDTVVYLQADYSSAPESSARAEAGASTVAAEAAATPTALPARISLPAARGNSYTSSRGINLYSNTQRMLAETPVTHIDVHA
jgi:hypothetical protein